MNMKENWFSYGESLSETSKSSHFGLVISAVNEFNAPKRDVTKYAISGRNGDIVIDNGKWNNIQISYKIMMSDVTPAKLNAVRNWLCTPIGYQKIYDSYDETTYREGFLSSDVAWTFGQLLRHGEATITFDCKPQRWLVQDSTGIVVPRSQQTGTAWTQVTNPTGFPAFPLVCHPVVPNVSYNSMFFTIYKDGVIDRRLALGSTIYEYFVFTGTNPVLWYDCEKLLCYMTNDEGERKVIPSRLVEDRYDEGEFKEVFSLEDMAIPDGTSSISITFVTNEQTFPNVTFYPRWWQI